MGQDSIPEHMRRFQIEGAFSSAPFAKGQEGT